MTLYLDTSALIKLYVEESGAETVADRTRRAHRIATSQISYAEARAAFARLQRTDRVTRAELRRLVGYLDRDWSAYQVVDVTESLVRHAGALAERHALRGHDAVQLASAVALRDAGADVGFMAFDADLGRAAARERLTLQPVEAGGLEGPQTPNSLGTVPAEP